MFLNSGACPGLRSGIRRNDWYLAYFVIPAKAVPALDPETGIQQGFPIMQHNHIFASLVSHRTKMALAERGVCH
ncbi:MAG: hypothetical protein COZ70_07280 [Deltaproteobacteria bacterium CG_4_8_14_3_um_filter_51_11]|nr:MAG: hypothetical protein AUK25_06930 [Desulfobacteraceae bacterium CG2_30_51_40]PIX19749.1 MAG: hypothetical protein COZ70_07280 [Deltaproteobacteria bacterium CG_4_8_14_3_um_filter_51_11]